MTKCVSKQLKKALKVFVDVSWHFLFFVSVATPADPRGDFFKQILGSEKTWRKVPVKYF